MYNSERVKANYQYYLSRGLCPRCGGIRKVMQNGKYCRECAQKNSEQKRKMRLKRIEQGLCTRCGAPLQDKKYKTCEKCRAYIRKFESARRSKYNKERYDNYKEQGICASCGQKWVIPGHVYCENCAAKNKKHKETYDVDGAKKRKLIDERREAGLCIDCGRPALKGKCRCLRCLEARRDSVRKYAIHKRTVKEGLQWEKSQC